MEMPVTALIDMDLALDKLASIYIHLSKQFNQTANHGGAVMFVYNNLKTTKRRKYQTQFHGQTKSNTTVSQQKNVTYSIPAAQNIRGTIQYHARGDTTTKTCSANSGLESNAQNYQALGAGGTIQFSNQNQNHQTTTVPASFLQELVEMSSGLGTLCTRSLQLCQITHMIQYPLKRFHQFHAQIRLFTNFISPGHIYELLKAVLYTEDNCSGNNQPKNMFGQENTAQNSSEKNTTLDHQTDIKPIRNEENMHSSEVISYEAARMGLDIIRASMKELNRLRRITIFLC